MDIFDFDDGRYDRYIIKEALHFYQKYNDWAILENEFRNKIDETRSWTDSQIHDCIEYIRHLLKKQKEASTGIYVNSDEWFSPGIDELRYWNYYKKTMKKEHWSNDRIEKLKKQCTDIVNFLPNPARICKDGNFKPYQKKGLVYGNVQAGKTASIAGLISMYASSGCPLIIVLSGVTNNLRWQTQERLIKDLHILDETGWHLLTPEKDRIGKNQPFVEALLAGNDVSIGVFKKNPYALTSLIRYCNQTSNDEVWKDNQVLIIDDECDQYSPNVTLRDEDDGTTYKHSAINGLIVDLMSLFPKCCYVGYTATPFANVLSEEPGEGHLYPEDFIYALDKNENYYGSNKIFGPEDDPDPVTLDAINIVDTEESRKLKDCSLREIPDSLRNAINYYIVAVACKYKRNLRDDFSTMLIHVDLKTTVHFAIEELVEEYISKVRKNWNNKDKNFISELKEIWNTEKVRNSPELVCSLFPDAKAEDYYTPELEDLFPEIDDVLSTDNLKLIVDNSLVPTTERLDYKKDEPRAYIVIGGNTLSRGLTLEGLTVSYFIRSSNTYDTLLQMGRWFGYRRKYEDLSRLWMLERLQEDFRFLCSIENEIRDEISNYTFGLTPSDYAMRIRTHFRMNITRALAMQAAKIDKINYSGTMADTRFLERKDINIINSNISATTNFLDSLPQSPSYYHNAWIYRNCDVDHILDYINNYTFDARNRSCHADTLIDYIQKAKEQNLLHKWNIVIKTKESGTPFQLSKKINVNLVTRSRIDEHIDNTIACLKGLREPADLMIDIDDYTWEHGDRTVAKQLQARQDYYSDDNDIPGLLIIYPIDKDSEPRNKNSKILTTLDANQHLIALMFVFPIIKNKELYQYMSIQLNNKEDEVIEDDDEY